MGDNFVAGQRKTLDGRAPVVVVSHKKKPPEPVHCTDTDTDRSSKHRHVDRSDPSSIDRDPAHSLTPSEVRLTDQPDYRDWAARQAWWCSNFYTGCREQPFACSSRVLLRRVRSYGAINRRMITVRKRGDVLHRRHGCRLLGRGHLLWCCILRAAMEASPCGVVEPKLDSDDGFE